MSRRTYTIRRYDNGRLTAKYRTFPLSREEFNDDMTEDDIKAFLQYSGAYYLVK